MQNNNVPSQQPIYPVLPVIDTVVLPTTEVALTVGRAKSLKAVEFALAGNKTILVSMQKNSHENPTIADMAPLGVICTIEHVTSGEKGEMHILVRGIQKVLITAISETDPFLAAQCTFIEDTIYDDPEVKALVHHIASEVKKAIQLGKALDVNFLMNVLYINNAQTFSYQVLSVLDITTSQKQRGLEEVDLKKRLQMIVEYLTKEIQVLELEHNIERKTNQKISDTMRENILREKMRSIEEELGGKDGADKDVKELKDKVKNAGMPPEILEKAEKELKRLQQMSQFNPEAPTVRSYIETLVELPWNTFSPQTIDISEAARILDEDHFGLKKVKERILEYLAVLRLHKEMEEAVAGDKKADDEVIKVDAKQPNILCFVGPPGVGKTSIGRSIARALSTKFVKISLGGVRDEAEIRGHRRTYVGSMPGRFIKAMKQAGVRNPVFMLDEVDKLGNDYRGDPAAALLEALDPEQNHAFEDHYLEVPFDLSQVFFITTANQLDTIPPALLDRLEIIHFAGYTEDEKYNIAKNYIVEKQRKAHALKEGQVNLTEAATREIIRKYTREAGVRELERQIATVMRKVARQVVEGKSAKVTVDEKDIPKYLGVRKYSATMKEDVSNVGISTGLAWTSVGGDILFIEVSTMPGKGNLTLTGNLGEVMKESAQAALSYIRSRHELFRLDKNFFNTIDIHVHVPEGATPKDGPSAGAAMTTAMVSALTKVPVHRDVAMTGEITLRGRVTEIGGLKEKAIAAHRAGIKTILIPRDNEKDLIEDVPENVRKDIKFVLIDRIEDALKEALVLKDKKLNFTPVKSTPLAKKGK